MFSFGHQVRVNGRNAHPLFVFLKAKLPGYLGTKIQYHWTKVRAFTLSYPDLSAVSYRPERTADEANRALQ